MIRSGLTCWFRRWMAATMPAGASMPCTAVGAKTSLASGSLRAMVLRISCSAAPVAEVTTPMTFGEAGMGRLWLGSNSPSASRRAFRRKNSWYSAPSPAGRNVSTYNCTVPPASYTLIEPCASTAMPSRGAKPSRSAMFFHITQRICASLSLSVKYRCPERGCEKLETSPLTQISCSTSSVSSSSRR